MDWKLELVAIPVSDVDRAKAFYVEQAGFVADHDHVVTDELRFVQLTLPGFGVLDHDRNGHHRIRARHRAGAARRRRLRLPDRPRLAQAQRQPTALVANRRLQGGSLPCDRAAVTTAVTASMTTCG